jgi:hypothetical protein
MRRRHQGWTVAAAWIVAGAPACDSFTSAPGATPLPRDAAPADSPGAQAAECTPEPTWANADTADSGVVSTATCNGRNGIDLLTTPQHCGRCNHSCGEDTCVRGYCVPREVAPGKALLLTTDESAIYYISVDTKEIARVVPGAAPTTLTRFDGDAGAGFDQEVVGGAVDETMLWLRTRNALYKTPKDSTTPSPILVLGLEYDSPSAIVSNGSKLWLTQATAGMSDPANGRVIEVDKTTGEKAPLVSPSPAAVEARLLGSRFVWLEQPWTILKPGGTRVRVRQDGVNYSIHDDVGDLGALTLLGSDAFVLRYGPNGGVFRIDLDGMHMLDLVAPDAIERDFSLGSLAVDSTHVYWVHPKPNGFGRSTILKRARCGGEIVTLAPEVYGASRLVLFRDRLYMSSYENIRSITK